MAIDFSTDLGKVRLLISDIDEANPIFEDSAITGFLGIETNVKMAAALALDAIATSEALIGKVIRTQDLATDAAKLADALRKHANQLRQSAMADDEFYFDIADFTPYHTTVELVERGFF